MSGKETNYWYHILLDDFSSSVFLLFSSYKRQLNLLFLPSNSLLYPLAIHGPLQFLRFVYLPPLSVLVFQESLPSQSGITILSFHVFIAQNIGLRYGNAAAVRTSGTFTSPGILLYSRLIRSASNKGDIFPEITSDPESPINHNSGNF